MTARLKKSAPILNFKFSFIGLLGGKYITIEYELQAHDVSVCGRSNLPLQEKIDFSLRRHRTHPVELAIFPESLYIKARVISSVPLCHNSLADGHGWWGLDTSFARIRQRHNQGRAVQLYSNR